MHVRALLPALLLSCFAALTQAAPPTLIHYQGLAVDTEGALLTGPIDVTVRLFVAPTGGAALWTESHSQVPTHDGVFSILLGSSVPLTPALLGSSSALWLELEVEGEILSPRQRLASVPYALQAGCNPGDIVDCYDGAPPPLETGSCNAGRRRCGVDGTWGPCLGATPPVAEICTDGVDNDCDGSSDCADPSCAAVPPCNGGCLDDGDCPADTVSACGTCSYPGVCAADGTRLCTCTSYACVAGTCQATATSCPQGCSRNPLGMGCGTGGRICCEVNLCTFQPCP